VTIPDHFSAHAARYGAYRPTYPDALFEYLASLVPAHDLAWDCATGNGQAALGLTPNTTLSSPPTPARSRSPGLAPTEGPLPRRPRRADALEGRFGRSRHRPPVARGLPVRGLTPGRHLCVQ
jgi:hypothetical protein